MNFHDTHERLVDQVRSRLQNGEITERALARHLGLSQPHVNNVLRGRRKFSPEVADLLLKFFHFSLLDLYADVELRTNLHQRLLGSPGGDMVSVLRYPLGPGNEWLPAIDRHIAYRLPCSPGRVLECTVFARLARDPRMAAMLYGCDMALLDLSISARSADCPSGVFALRHGGDTVLRWIRGGFRTLYIADEQNLDRPLEWKPLAMCEGQRLDFVKARVLWLGAEASLRRAESLTAA